MLDVDGLVEKVCFKGRSVDSRQFEFKSFREGELSGSRRKSYFAAGSAYLLTDLED